MTPVKVILAGLALLFVVSQTRAEYRTVLVQVKQDKDKNVSVTIHSDEKKEQKSAASMADAVKLIAEMQGWGSGVGVYVTCDKSVPRPDVKKLLAAINDNAWLDLEYFGREVPKTVGDHFLKAGPPLPRGNAPLPELAKNCKGALVATLLEVGDAELGPPGAADYTAKWQVTTALRSVYPKTAHLSFRVQSLPEKSRERPPTVGKAYILITDNANAGQIVVILDADEESLRMVQDLLKR